AGAAGTALTLARAPGTRPRVVQLVLGTLRAALGHGQRTLQRGRTALGGADALGGLQQRLVDAAGSLRRALLHVGTGDAGGTTARTGAVRLQAGRAHGRNGRTSG